MQLGLGLGLTHVQQAGGGGGEEIPEWLENFLGPNDEVPYVVADFQNGNYWLDGEEVAVGDLFESLEGIGNWRPQDIVPGQGLPCTDVSNTAPFKAPISVALCADGFTVRTVFSNDETSVVVVGMIDAPGFTQEMKVLAADHGDCALLTTAAGLTGVGFVPTYSHKVAATLSLTNFSASIHGQPVVVYELPPEIPTPTRAWLGVGGDEGGVGFLEAASFFLPMLDNADLDDLAFMSVWVTIDFNGNTEITEFVRADLTGVLGNISFGGCESFVTFDCPNLVEIGGNVNLPGCALNQATVDAILMQLAALDGTGDTTTYDGHDVDLSGGTNAVPSATGLTAKATLEGRGNTVTVNE